jgi:hypothetical protein
MNRGSGSPQLVVEDILATTQRTANDIPDWRIEGEASKAAYDRNATYL